MASFWDRINPLSSKSYTLPIANKNFRKGASSFLFGSPEKRENVSLLREEQEPLFNQLMGAGMDRGAGGAFGTSADFYRDILSNDPQMLQELYAPEFRRFNQDIIPGLAEQFAGMGSGALSSSGFRNSATQAGTDLAERLAQMRMNLRQNAASGLTNIGQIGLGNYSQNMVTQPGSQGFLGAMAPAIGTAVGSAFGDPIGGALGNMAGNMFSSGVSGNSVGQNTSPYGKTAANSAIAGANAGLYGRG